MGHRKIEFIALLLPILGMLMILPPLVSIRNISAEFFGFPAIIAYLFGVWLLLIISAFFLQRRIPPQHSEQSDQSENPND